MTFSKNLYTFPSIARRKFSAGNPHILLRLSSRASRLFNEFGTQIIRHTDTQDSTEEGAFLFFTFRYFKTLSDAKFRLAFMENRIFKLPHYTGYDSMSFISGAWQSSSTLICKKVNLISWHRHCYSMSGLAVHKQKLTCCSLFDPIRQSKCKSIPVVHIRDVCCMVFFSGLRKQGLGGYIASMHPVSQFCELPVVQGLWFRGWLQRLVNWKYSSIAQRVICFVSLWCTW